MKHSGIYILVIKLNRKHHITFGKYRQNFSKGYYIYTGSALNGLEHRISRHLKVKEPKHWHIDKLLSAGKIIDIQVLETNDKNDECRLAKEVATWPDGKLITGFGSSDCHCASHLTFFQERPFMTIHSKKIMQSFNRLISFFEEHYIDHAVFDRHPFQTLITCILSLRTRDPVTHAASKRLFSKFTSPEEFVNLNSQTIEKLIFPVGMFREKSRRLIEISRQLIDNFDGCVPREINNLLTLPGVGRKTANLVRSFAFHLPAICVDVHVHRIFNRLGLMRTATPDETEMGLRRIIPQKYWICLNPFMVQHGQQLCHPLQPGCNECGLEQLCQYKILRKEHDIISTISTAPTHPSLKIRHLKQKNPRRQAKYLSPFE